MSGRILLPGDLIPETTVTEGAQKDPRVVGCGIVRKNKFMTANRPGLLREDGNKQWLRVSSRKYWPQVGDAVLGIITAKSTDSFKVDIASAEPANVSMLNFEGATKRNKPSLKEGDMIYARVIVANKHMEAELTCVDEENRGRGMGGVADGGYNFLVPLDVAHRLLCPQYPMLNLIGRDIKFEITIGVNGRIWINAGTQKEILAIRKMIIESEQVGLDDVRAFVNRSIAVMKGVSVAEPEPMNED